jgi:hypothetical protein
MHPWCGWASLKSNSGQAIRSCIATIWAAGRGWDVEQAVNQSQRKCRLLQSWASGKRIIFSAPFASCLVIRFQR